MEIKLLSVIVPIYKNEKTIKKNLIELNDILKDTQYNYEIIGVVDGIENDHSYEYARSIINPYLNIIGYRKNRGKGLAVRYGMLKARGDVIIFIDSGGDINPGGIRMLLEHMKWYDADIVVGSKLHPASKVNNYPLFKTKIYYIINKVLFRLKIRDTQTGLKAYKREVLEHVLGKMLIKRFAFDIELLAVAKHLGFYKIYDAPVEINYDVANSTYFKTSFYKEAFNVLYDTLSVWYRIFILGYYDNDKQRESYFDEELGIKINTGNLYNEKQNIIDMVNKYSKYLHIFSNDRLRKK